MGRPATMLELVLRDGRPARPAHCYHGSRQHGSGRNAGGLHRSGLVTAGTGALDARLVRRTHALRKASVPSPSIERSVAPPKLERE